MSLSPTTIKRLRSVQRAILKHADLYDQEDPSVPEVSCGTMGCIMGFAYMLFGGSPNEAQEAQEVCVDTEGTRLLGLTPQEGTRLFSACFNSFRNPELDDIYEAYIKAPEGSAARAQCAVDRIEHFIKTEGLE